MITSRCSKAGRGPPACLRELARSPSFRRHEDPLELPPAGGGGCSMVATTLRDRNRIAFSRHKLNYPRSSGEIRLDLHTQTESEVQQSKHTEQCAPT